MVATGQLPIPQITARRFGARCLPALTDDALYERTGVRVAFTGRAGGVSEGPYSSLNWVITWATALRRSSATERSCWKRSMRPTFRSWCPARCTGKSWWSSTTASPEALDAARGSGARRAPTLFVATVPGSRRCCASPTASP